MSKRSPGTKAAQKAGKAQHIKERQRHRDKVAKRKESLSEAFTDALNVIGEAQEKEDT